MVILLEFSFLSGDKVMLKKIIGLTIITLLFAIVPNAQSKQPTPSKGILGSNNKTQAADKQQNAKADQRGSEKWPLFIKIAPSPNAQEEAAQAKKDKEEKTAANRRSEIITWIIAIFTSVQAIALILTVIIMIRTTRRQLRAYMFVDKVFISNVANPLPRKLLGGKSDEETPAAISRPLEGPLAYLEFKNSGQTPAYDVVVWGDIVSREFPLTSLLPHQDPIAQWVAKASVPPGGGTNKTSGIQQPLSAEEIDKLRTIPPTAAIYIYGTITYKDTFGKKRFTHYRFFHNSLSGILGRHTGMSICDEGNASN